jgi:phosphatidylserine decarboxylase
MSADMVRDGIWYALALGFIALAFRLALPGAVWLCAIPLLLAAFFLWFFRDPQRAIPAGDGIIVSPADGKVTAVETVQTEDGQMRPRLSIFLSVFDVHVNRSPIAGAVTKVVYKRGKFLNAMDPNSAVQNEQNIVTVADSICDVTFKQIAGLLARRIVFTKRDGDLVQRGERVGMIKFGSRVDVLLPRECDVQVRIGDHVKGGESVLAVLGSARVHFESEEAIGLASPATVSAFSALPARNEGPA